MRFYTHLHRYYVGIDLHARPIFGYPCAPGPDRNTVFEKALIPRPGPISAMTSPAAPASGCGETGLLARSSYEP
jgi:hypothetical protein